MLRLDSPTGSRTGAKTGLAIQIGTPNLSSRPSGCGLPAASRSSAARDTGSAFRAHRQSGALPCLPQVGTGRICFQCSVSGFARSPVPEPRLQNSRTFRAIGFSLQADTRWDMPGFRIGTFHDQRFPRWVLGLGICLLACKLPLLADTPSLLRRAPVGSCYCHCAESKASRGCVKMCESKRYANRWWATNCAKPHMHTPLHDSHAGPRFPHPGRAEHAELGK